MLQIIYNYIKIIASLFIQSKISLPKDQYTTKQVNFKTLSSNICLKVLVILFLKKSISVKRVHFSLIDFLKHLYLRGGKGYFQRELLKFILIQAPSHSYSPFILSEKSLVMVKLLVPRSI